MAIYFSPAALGFFSSELHSQLPADAIDITPQAHEALLAGQAEGKFIAAGPGGAPMLIDPPPPASVVPHSVTRFQARAALMQAGLFDQVTAAVAAAEDPMITLAWAESVELLRNSPTIATLSAALGLTEAEVDALFIAASQISA